ncbi:MAG: DNA (cytosine-5-)-methyltransferase [Bacillota bacterium]
MNQQLNIFDMIKEKKVRLVEMFAGIGSQAQALTNIGVDFEHYRVCEFDKYAVTSYNAIHGTNFETTNICDLKGADLGIVDCWKYNYLLTYSFPCTDLSLAGKRQGMEKGSGTRSGLLWEVERLLIETEHLPQFLLMENVPQVHGKKNREDFDKWCKFLESKGYHNYWQDLNAKKYGIPQNRNRCFMVSSLDEINYQFPQEIELERFLIDMLEDEVDEKYFISDAQLDKIINSTFTQRRKHIQTKDVCDTICARDYKEPHMVIVGSLINMPYAKMHENSCRVYDPRGICPTINACGGGHREPKIIQRAHGFNKGAVLNLCPTITTSPGFPYNNVVICAMRGRNPDNPSDQTAKVKTEQMLEFGGGVSNTLTTVQKDNLVAYVIDDTYPSREVRLYRNIAPSLRGQRVFRVYYKMRIRKLTPLECWRLMGFKDEQFHKAKKALNDTFYKGNDRSNSQLYKQAGNSIVVDVLEGIFKNLLL